MNARAKFEADLVDDMPRLRAMAMAWLRDRARAEDVMSSALLRALRSWEQFQPGSNFKAWTSTILRNEMISLFRKNKRTPVPIDDVMVLDIPCRQPSAVDVLHAQDIRRALALLPPHTRQLVVDVCGEGMSYDEMAAKLGCSVGTVKSRLWRARGEVARLMGVSE